MALRSGYKGFKKVGSGLSISKDGILKATGGGGGGSTVEINPAGAATAGRLNKLKVDDDIVTVSYGNATTEAAGLMSADDKTKLNGIEAQANKYVLPTASTSELGGVKVDGTTVTIEDGVISATGGGGGTTVTPNPEGSATTDLTKLGIDATIYGVKDSGAYHTDDSTESTFADSDYVPFYDASASAPKKSTWSNLKAKLKTYFDSVYNNYVLPIASASELGGVKVGSGLSIDSSGVLSATGGGGGGDIYIPMIPYMTANDMSLGQVSAHASASDTPPWNATNGTPGPGAGHRWGGQYSSDAYFQYKFTEATRIDRIAIIPGGGQSETYTPCSVTLKGSNDGASWTDLKTFSIAAADNTTRMTQDIENNNAYEYYRLAFSAANMNTFCGLREFQLYQKI